MPRFGSLRGVSEPLTAKAPLPLRRPPLSRRAPPLPFPSLDARLVVSMAGLGWMMTWSYAGVVQNGVVPLPDDTPLADGTVVEIRVLIPAGNPSEQLTPDSPLAHRLLASGLMSEIKPPLRSLPEGDRTPIQVEGESLSETIIRERQ